MANIYRLFFFCALLLTATSRFSWAQQVAPSAQSSLVAPAAEPNYTHVIDSLLQYVSKAPVPSNILYDRVYPGAMLHAFNQGRVDSSYSEHFQQAYQELYTASYNRGSFPLTPEQVTELADRGTAAQPVLLGVLDYAFGLLDTTAVDAQLLEFRNGLYYDVPGRARSPFLSRQLSLAAALTRDVYQTAGLKLSAALCLSNRGRTVTGVTVQLGNNRGAVSCTPNKLLNVQFAATGIQLLRYTIQFSDGSTAQAASVVNVLPDPAAARAPDVKFFVTSPGTFTNYEQTERVAGEGEAGLYLHHPSSLTDRMNSQSRYLRNPIIVLDGIDDGDKRDIRTIYEQQLPGLVELINNGSSPANAANRDLIILNFPKNTRSSISVSGGVSFLKTIDGGDDYIERNALALIELINRLKPLLANPAEKFTIIGPSMGGMISRYALAYMEKAYAVNGDPYYDHQTAEWISFDAPHQGANVPIGVQAYVEYMKFSSGAKKLYNNNILSPASRQLLLSHVLAGQNVTQGAPGYRDRFMLALRDNGLPGSLGYPVNLRRIGLANGSLSGWKRPENPGSTALNMVGRLRWPYMALYFVLAKSTLFFLSPRINGEFLSTRVAFSPAANTSGKVFEGSFQIGLRVLNGIFPIQLRSRSFSVASGPQGSYDVAPGGYYDAQRQAKAEGEKSDNGWLGGWVSPFDIKFSNVKDFHSFISVASALGYNYQSLSSYQNTSSLPSPYQNLSTQNLVCTGQTPFDAYYAPLTSNTEHVTLSDAGMQQFLGRELFRLTPTPVFASAPTAVCPDGTSTATFTLPLDCTRPGQPATTYTWTLSGPAVFAATNTQTVTDLANSQDVRSTASAGTATLTVTAQRMGALPSAPVSVPVLITSGSVGLQTSSGGQDVCISTTVTVQATSYGGASVTNWRVTNGQLLYVSGDEATVQVSASPGVTTVHADYVTNCPGSGSSSSAAADIYVVDNQNGFFCAQMRVGDPKEAVYPNPADAHVDIRSPFAAARPYRIELHNDRGGRVYGETARSSAVRVDTHSLPNGLYHLTLRQGNQSFNYNLSIQH